MWWKLHWQTEHNTVEGCSISFFVENCFKKRLGLFGVSDKSITLDWLRKQWNSHVRQFGTVRKKTRTTSRGHCSTRLRWTQRPWTGTWRALFEEDCFVWSSAASERSLTPPSRRPWDLCSLWKNSGDWTELRQTSPSPHEDGSATPSVTIVSRNKVFDYNSIGVSDSHLSSLSER